MNEIYTVYAKTDEQGRITAVNSSAFIGEAEGWTQIDEGTGDRYHHAQANYFPLPIYTEDGVCRYKLEAGETLERSAEEIAADIAAFPPPPPTKEEQLQQQIDALTIALLEG